MIHELWERLTHKNELIELKAQYDELLQVCQAYEHQIKCQLKAEAYRLQQIKEYDDEILRYKITLESQKIEIDDKNRAIERLKAQINNPEENEYTIEIPEYSIEQLKEKIKMADEPTVNMIINYLVLDNFELVKNIAPKIDKENSY